MKNKFITLLFIVFLSIFQVFGKDFDKTPSKVQDFIDKLPKLQNIECKFKQEKYLPNVEKPITSRGDFKFVENVGVYFDTTYPIKNHFEYTNKDYRQINDIILGISNKKYSKIEREFDFFFNQSENSWKLTLHPKQSSKTNGFIDYISIEGNKKIDKISIDMTNGNKTKIWFLDK